MKYQEAVEQILNIPKFAKKTGTDNLKQLLEQMGNPQDKVPCIHVAGTNGKGSVCAFLSSVLMEAGYQVGMFTSPHLVSINERFRYNGHMISNREFTELYEKIKGEIEIFTRKGFPHPSFFEVLFVMAALWFSEKDVQYVIYETGLGGRLDATNVIKPEVAVITSIGLDHTEYLGETIKEIAGEKAGIVKEKTPVVYFNRDREAKKVIEETAVRRNAPIFSVEKEDYIIDEITHKRIDFSINCRYYKYDSLSIKRTGLYQVENALLAVAVLRLGLGISIEEEIIKRGLFHMQWEGRMEEVKPRIIIDGAHNEEAIKVFRNTLDSLYGNKKKILLFAVAKEKAYDAMIRDLCQGMHYEGIFITAIDGERSTDVKIVEDAFRSCTQDVIYVYPDIKEAFLKAQESMHNEAYLFCVGSLYLAGSLKSCILD